MSTAIQNQALRSPEQYDIIRLESENEICLHALTILQADHLSCYIPILPTEDRDSYLLNTDDCVPLSDLSLRDRFYVRRHIHSLISDFLLDIISSMDHFMGPQGIFFSQDQLYFNRQRKSLSCVYLPLHSTLRGKQVSLSGIEEAWLDELFRIPLDNKWISSQQLEKLYQYFRDDKEDDARFFVSHTIWKHSSTLTANMKRALSFWCILLFLYACFSTTTEKYFQGTLMARLPFFLLLISTVTIVISLFLSEKQRLKDHKLHDREKSQRRKTRNAQILFPGITDIRNDVSKYEFSDEPVQFTDVSSPPVHERTQSFTIWTKGFTVGLDSDCCDLAIDHSSISLKHAYFGTDEYGFFMEDLNSRQGSFVNRKRIEPYEKCYVSEGDIVGIGQKEFIVHFVHDTKS